MKLKWDFLPPRVQEGEGTSHGTRPYQPFQRLARRLLLVRIQRSKSKNGYKREGENERKKFERGIELKDNAQFIILLFIVTAHAVVTSFFSLFLSLWLSLSLPTSAKREEFSSGNVVVPRNGMEWMALHSHWEAVNVLPDRGRLCKQDKVDPSVLVMWPRDWEKEGDGQGSPFFLALLHFGSHFCRMGTWRIIRRLIEAHRVCFPFRFNDKSRTTVGTQFWWPGGEGNSSDELRPLWNDGFVLCCCIIESVSSKLLNVMSLL